MADTQKVDKAKILKVTGIDATMFSEGAKAGFYSAGASVDILATLIGLVKFLKASTSSMDVVDVTKIAEALNVTPRQIQLLSKRGILKKSDKGKYHWPTVVADYVRWLESEFKRPEAETNIRSEKLRGMKLDNDQREIETAAKIGSLIPLEHAAGLWEMVIITARARALSAARNLKSELSKGGKPDMLAKKIDEHFDQILRELAAIEVGDYDPAEKVEADASPGKNNGQRVGGKISKA